MSTIVSAIQKEWRGFAIASRPDANQYRQVIGHFPSGVTVVTTRHSGADFGMTASAVTSLSLDPPMLLVCINKAAPTGDAIQKSGVFGVSVLTDQQGNIAEQFARPSPDKFSGARSEPGVVLDVPSIGGALACLECRVVEEVTGGTHTVFLAEVVRAEARAGSPLAYFRGGFGRLETSRDDAVYDRLRQIILGGELSEGEALDLDRLEQLLDVEKWDLYQALTRLLTEGLVDRSPDGAYVVIPLDLTTVIDSLEGRRAIELGAVELGMERADHDDIVHLGRLAEATAPWIEDGGFVDVDRYAKANTAFHEHLVGTAKSESLLLAYRRLALPGLLARTLRASQPASNDLIADHRQLVETFRRRDVVGAKRVINEHTDRSIQTHQVAATSR